MASVVADAPEDLVSIEQIDSLTGEILEKVYKEDIN
jgi:hypothetical protein